MGFAYDIISLLQLRDKRCFFMEKISVIVPVYNSDDYIMDCLNSLKSQTYKEIEILIINDGSNKNCTQKLEKLINDDTRIKLYNFNERKGVGFARNYGINKATGKYIYFMDSDDYLPKRTLEILVNHINNYDIIRGRMKKVNSNRSFAIIYQGVYNVKNYADNKFNLIKNNSCLNFLIKRDFILKNKLAFSEDVELFSDLEFMVSAMNKTGNIAYIREAVYFKRNRNDPIKRPSLSQSSEELVIGNFLQQYSKLKGKYRNKLTNDFLDTQLLNFYRKDILLFFKQESNVDLLFDDLCKAVNLISAQNLKKYDFVLKREINAIKNRNLKKYKKINSNHQFLRDLREGIKSKRKFYTFLYNRIFTKMRIKPNLVLFESFSGKNYSDSPKYIYEYMMENMDYKFVWSVNEPKSIPGNHIQVKRFSLKYFYYLARAKYWVSNARFPNFINKREDNVYLQTWHGTPLKKLAGDMEDVHMPGTNSVKYKQNFYKETQKWDYLISPNEYSSKIFKRAFWFKNTMIETGYPRNDILYSKNNEESIKKLKEKIGLPLDKKIIMYAPTWRDDEYYSKGNYKFTLRLNLEKLQRKLGEDYIIILRMHYLIASELDISNYIGFAFDLSSYDDISELYLVSDILITDYSSVFFDYANLKRPILFFTYDLEKYRDQLRGFYIDMEEEVPGPLLMNNEQVVNAIINIDDIKKEYKDRYSKFYNRFCLWDDGNASKKTVEKVFKDNLSNRV